MDVCEAIRNRRSTRQYITKKIEKEKLNKILEAARLAPSAMNRQEWKFVVVRDDNKKKQIMEAAGGQKFIYEASDIIIGCATESQKIMYCGQYAYTVDLSIAFSYMMLEAQELGIGSCWIGHFDENKIKKILSIPDNVRIVAIAPFGYSNEKDVKKSRKDLKEIICYEQYK